VRPAIPESLAISLAAGLRAVYHHKWNLEADVILAVSPEHSRVFEQAGWSKARLRQELEALLQMETAQMVKGAGGCAEQKELMPKSPLDKPSCQNFSPAAFISCAWAATRDSIPP